MDQTKRPLQIPPEFSIYAETHGIFDLYKRLLEQVIIMKPPDPIYFLIELLKRDVDLVPQVIILGPPASGKHSIAKMICLKLRTAHLTASNMLADTEVDLKYQWQEYVERGEPIPLELWGKIISERVKVFDCIKKGWVMENFPETREQALMLQNVGVFPHHVVILEAPDTVLIERAAGKRIDPKTGDCYHTVFDWPTNPEVQNRLDAPSGCTEAEMVEKLVKYHRNIEGIKPCYAHVTKMVNADQPKADVFAQVMTYVSSQFRTNAPQTPRVVLLGPTGSGKNVQAALLASKYGVVSVSCGQLIKQAVAEETKEGQASKTYTDRDLPVPDSITMKILVKRLSQLDCVTKGWVLFGYPMNREQAEQLTRMGYAPNRVIILDVPSDSLIERLTLRATDPVTGERFHTLYNPPSSYEVKKRLICHPKDSDNEVRKRLAQYFAYSEELGDFYTQAQHVNGDQDPHTVYECIESIIVNPLPKHYGV